MIISTSIAKIKFIVHVRYVAELKSMVKLPFQISASLKKWKIEYLTMNKIYSIIITEREKE